jgi:hypothetical protein
MWVRERALNMEVSFGPRQLRLTETTGSLSA